MQTNPDVKAILKLIIGEKALTKKSRIPEIIKNTPKEIERFIKFIGLTWLASKILHTAPQKRLKIIDKNIIRITGIASINPVPNQYFIITSANIIN
jgi:hypothetical protein